MGVQSRGYMYGPRPTRRFYDGRSLASWIILLNAAVFVLWQVGPNSPGLSLLLDRHFRVSAAGVLDHGMLHTLITYAFSHQALWHAFWNLLFVWWFGRELEEMYGSGDFAVLYFSAGLAAGLGHVVLHALWAERGTPALGASGAVMGVVIVYALHYPDRPIYLFGAFPLALKWLATIYVATDLLGVMQEEQGKVAHAAHLGGAIMGFLYWKLDLRIFAEGARFRWGWLRRRTASPPRPRHPDAEDEPHPSLDPGMTARVDELLEKIARQGIGSLTPEERDFLDSASRHYRG